jgi:TonB family protein
MFRPFALLVLVAARLPAQHVTETIETPRGPCLVWAVPSGSSNLPADASYRRCALDRPPMPRLGQEMPPSPRFFPGAGSSLRIVVNPDGSVDQRLSRSSSRTHDVEFHEQALATIKRWQFEPGMRAGIPVRSTIELGIATDNRASDTVPMRLEWRYVPGWESDRLSGRWITEAPLTSFAHEQVDSVHAAMLRQLSAMGVIHPTRERGYCIASADSGASAEARVTRIARAVRRAIPQLDTGACVDTPTRVRILLPRVHRTENGRAVLYIAGAQLPRWPTGFDARAWPRWKGRCIGAVRGVETVPVTCDVEADVPREEVSYWRERLQQARSQARSPRSAREPVNVTVLATMYGAYGIDTFRVRLPRVPRFRNFAQRDSLPMLDSWFVWSPNRGDSTAYVVNGDPTGSGLRITPAQFDRAPETLGPSSHTSSDRPDRFVAFLLGGVGTRPLAPLTLCFGFCARRFVLDARRHTLQPIVRFRVASLRDVSRSLRGPLQLRVLVDPSPDGLIPVLVIASPAGKANYVFFLRDLGGGMWEWFVNYSADWMTREAFVYLVRR